MKRAGFRPLSPILMVSLRLEAEVHTQEQRPRLSGGQVRGAGRDVVVGTTDDLDARSERVVRGGLQHVGRETAERQSAGSRVGTESGRRRGRTTNGRGKGINKTWAQVHALRLGDGTRVPITTETIFRYGEAPGNSSTAKVGGGVATEVAINSEVTATYFGALPQLVVGTDYPFPWTQTAVDEVLTVPGFSDEDKRAVLGGTAARLLGIKT